MKLFNTNPKPNSGIIAVLLFAILTAVSVLPSNAQSQMTDLAVSRAKNFVVAMTNGDVSNMKRLSTPGFYRENFPYSDEEVRSRLLRVPVEKRQKLRNQIQNSTESVEMDYGNNTMTIRLRSTETNKTMTFFMVDERNNNDWKISDYYY